MNNKAIVLPVELRQLLSNFTHQDITKQHQLAYNNNQIELVKYLLHSKDLPFNSSVHYIDLHLVCRDGNFEMFKFLMSEFKEKDTESFQDILEIAAQEGRLDIFKFLLTSDDINIKPQINVNYRSVLWDACRYGHLNIVEYILTAPELECQANIHYGDDTALRYAIEKNNKEIIKFLLTSPKLKEHADINCKNGSLFRDLIVYGKNEILEFLLLDCEVELNSVSKSFLHLNPNIEKIYNMKQLSDQLKPNSSEIKVRKAKV